MKLVILFACSAGVLIGCQTDPTYRTGDVVHEPAGASTVPETWSEDPRDMNQRPYRHQFETERHQQFENDPPFTHDRLD